METPIADLRREYKAQPLNDEEVVDDPIVQFQAWFDEARRAGVADPNAMTLATATADGRPSARIVLLKDVDADGFVFFTNYGSRKGQELAENPWAALVFYWGELDRQVSIQGRVEKIPEAESVAYFRSRPRGSQLGAWASPQSRVVAGREVIEQNMRAAQARFEGKEVDCPPHWGGYRLRPTFIELWQGRPNRLHDRICYRREDGAWRIERLAP